MARTDQQLSLAALAGDVAVARPERRLVACALVVAVLHGLLLAWAGFPPGSGEVLAGGAAPQHAVRVRMLSMTAAPEPMPLQKEPSQEAAAPPEASTVERTEATQANPAVDQALASGQAEVDLTGYVPRRWLTVAPRPTAPVVLPFPAAFNDSAHYTVVLNLYIEADGRVGRVEFEGVPLPELLERAARTTFENARFTPGQVKGRIVKSLIRVEVDFDSLSAG